MDQQSSTHFNRISFRALLKHIPTFDTRYSNPIAINVTDSHVQSLQRIAIRGPKHSDFFPTATHPSEPLPSTRRPEVPRARREVPRRKTALRYLPLPPGLCMNVASVSLQNSDIERLLEELVPTKHFQLAISLHCPWLASKPMHSYLADFLPLVRLGLCRVLGRGLLDAYRHLTSDTEMVGVSEISPNAPTVRHLTLRLVSVIIPFVRTRILVSLGADVSLPALRLVFQATVRDWVFDTCQAAFGPSMVSLALGIATGSVLQAFESVCPVSPSRHWCWAVIIEAVSQCSFIVCELLSDACVGYIQIVVESGLEFCESQGVCRAALRCDDAKCPICLLLHSKQESSDDAITTQRALIASLQSGPSHDAILCPRQTDVTCNVGSLRVSDAVCYNCLVYDAICSLVVPPTFKHRLSLPVSVLKTANSMVNTVDSFAISSKEDVLNRDDALVFSRFVGSSISPRVAIEAMMSMSHSAKSMFRSTFGLVSCQPSIYIICEAMHRNAMKCSHGLELQVSDSKPVSISSSSARMECLAPYVADLRTFSRLSQVYWEEIPDWISLSDVCNQSDGIIKRLRGELGSASTVSCSSAHLFSWWADLFDKPIFHQYGGYFLSGAEDFWRYMLGCSLGRDWIKGYIQLLLSVQISEPQMGQHLNLIIYLRTVIGKAPVVGFSGLLFDALSLCCRPHSRRVQFPLWSGISFVPSAYSLFSNPHSKGVVDNGVRLNSGFFSGNSVSTKECVPHVNDIGCVIPSHLLSDSDDKFSYLCSRNLRKRCVYRSFEIDCLVSLVNGPADNDIPTIPIAGIVACDNVDSVSEEHIRSNYIQAVKKANELSYPLDCIRAFSGNVSQYVSASSNETREYPANAICERSHSDAVLNRHEMSSLSLTTTHVLSRGNINALRSDHSVVFSQALSDDGGIVGSFRWADEILTYTIQWCGEDIDQEYIILVLHVSPADGGVSVDRIVCIPCQRNFKQVSQLLLMHDADCFMNPDLVVNVKTLRTQEEIPNFSRKPSLTSPLHLPLKLNPVSIYKLENMVGHRNGGVPNLTCHVDCMKISLLQTMCKFSPFNSVDPTQRDMWKGKRWSDITLQLFGRDISQIPLYAIHSSDLLSHFDNNDHVFLLERPIPLLSGICPALIKEPHVISAIFKHPGDVLRNGMLSSPYAGDLLYSALSNLSMEAGNGYVKDVKRENNRIGEIEGLNIRSDILKIQHVNDGEDSWRRTVFLSESDIMLQSQSGEIYVSAEPPMATYGDVFQIADNTLVDSADVSTSFSGAVKSEGSFQCPNIHLDEVYGDVNADVPTMEHLMGSLSVSANSNTILPTFSIPYAYRCDSYPQVVPTVPLVLWVKFYNPFRASMECIGSLSTHPTHSLKAMSLTIQQMLRATCEIPVHISNSAVLNIWVERGRQLISLEDALGSTWWDRSVFASPIVSGDIVIATWPISAEVANCCACLSPVEYLDSVSERVEVRVSSSNNDFEFSLSLCPNDTIATMNRAVSPLISGAGDKSIWYHASSGGELSFSRTLESFGQDLNFQYCSRQSSMDFGASHSPAIPPCFVEVTRRAMAQSRPAVDVDGDAGVSVATRAHGMSSLLSVWFVRVYQECYNIDPDNAGSVTAGGRGVEVLQAANQAIQVMMDMMENTPDGQLSESDMQLATNSLCEAMGIIMRVPMEE